MLVHYKSALRGLIKFLLPSYILASIVVNYVDFSGDHENKAESDQKFKSSMEEVTSERLKRLDWACKKHWGEKRKTTAERSVHCLNGKPALSVFLLLQQMLSQNGKLTSKYE